MDVIQGFVDKITYRNAENGYTVLHVSGEDGESTLVGVFPEISEGETIRAEGEITVHPTYGPQLKVAHYEFVIPDEAQSIERYLASGAVKGIGKALARRVVAKFGDDTFRIMEEEPERLAEVKGISLRSAMDLAGEIVRKRETRNAMIYLQQFGVTIGLAAKIYKAYGNELYAVMKEDPYRLAEDIRGVGFLTADEIASKANIARDSDSRIRAAVLYVLQNESGNGHMYLPKDELFTLSESLLGIELSDFDHILQDLAIAKKIKVEKKPSETRVYLTSFYKCELKSAILLHDLNLREKTTHDTAEVVERIEREKKIELDDLQRSAVMTAAENGLTVITGGPGTGKTTTILVMIEYFLERGLNVALAAPTGRAAKRMSEATGYEALTIHRLLEANGDPEDGDRPMKFNRNADHPIESDVVIIDEMSMVDSFLMCALLDAIVPGMRLILVGDADQLPSVGPGEVLKDLIRSEAFPVVRFRRIFRQAEESDIIVNAHRIIEGDPVEKKPSKDFLFVERALPGEIVGATITLLRSKLPNYVHADTKDLQVLCPMKKGPLGVENLNKLLQAEFNPPSPGKKEREFGSQLFREGDKVMQIKNDYDLTWEIENAYPKITGTGVFNGEIGFVREISSFTESVTIEFDDRKIVTVPFSLMDELELAYAVTIHKSQGSEYPAVVLPLHSGPDMLLTRNLLYTAVTRAKSCVTIVGRYDTFLRMIANNRTMRRYTGLSDMIRELHGMD